MRRAGLRLVQLWVVDTSAPGFAEECRRQSRVAARNKQVENDVTAWIEANADTEGWTSAGANRAPTARRLDRRHPRAAGR